MRTVVAALAVLMLTAACTGGDGAGDRSVVVEGYVHAGPTCPVVQDPPDPNCADRPVPGAQLEIWDAGDGVLETVATADDGTFSVLLAPGSYTLVPQPVDGLLGTAERQSFDVAETPVALDVAYDTGIR